MFYQFECANASLTTDGVDSGRGSETVLKVWYQTAKKLQTDTEWRREKEGEKARMDKVGDKTKIFIGYRWHDCAHTTHLNTRTPHLPSAITVLLDIVFWFQWQQSRQAGGRHSCPGYILLPGIHTEQNIRVIDLVCLQMCKVVKDGQKNTSLAARSCWTIAELTVLGMVWILSSTGFNRSRTPWNRHTL